MTLPSNWIRSTIGEVTTYVQRGKGPKYSEKNAFPVINQKAIRWNGIQEEHLKYVREDTWEKYTEERYIRAGDILWNSTGTGTIGRACLLDEAEAAKAKVVDSHVTIVRSNTTKVIPSYLFYWIKSPRIQFEIASLYTGTTNQVELSKSKVLDTEIPLAPLAEQSRIVEKLDSIFGKLEMAQSRLEKVPQLLKRFRMSVLSAAVAGELTEEWRDANNADDWEHVSLKQVGQGFNYGSSAKSKKEGSVPVLRMGNLQNGKLDWSDLVYTSDEKEIEKYKLEAGDVLFNRTNSPELVGKTSIYRGEREAIFAGYLIKVQGTDRLNSEYLNIQLNSPHARDYCWQVKTDGVSQSNINAQKLKAYEFNLPSIEEQEEIVRVVSELLAKSDLVKKQYEIAKLRVDKLTQSILARAFRGELFEPFTDKADRVAQPQSADVTDEQSSAAEEASLEQLDKSPTQPRSTTKAVNDNSELLAQLKSVKKAMTAQQLFDSSSFETFKAIDELFVELKRLLELNLVEKVGEGENCQFKAAK
ncbi:restriction endonuclease subunit S [Vibrio metschnikovii]|nr:restriction endonuclease subunit S [Vibrio metschnikovii]